MQRQNIRIATNDGGEQIKAYVSLAFPGLAVHRNAQFDDTWNATHIQSGLAVSTMFPLRRCASCFAALAARLLDFTQSGEHVEDEVADKPDVRSKLRELAERFKK